MLRKFFASSPVAARVAPFIIFVLLTAAQGKFGAQSAYWFYLVKTIIGAWLIFEMRPFVPEMRWAISWEAIVAGVAVFILWIGLNPFYPTQSELFAKLGFTKSFSNQLSVWNPNVQLGNNSFAAWFFISIHILGMTLVVPPLEEVFYRSFLYRYIANQKFLSVPLNKFLPLPFFLTAIFFALEHQQWLAGFLCGLIFQWLVLKKNRLGDAITAHAITNFLLGIWIVGKHAWNFW
jgi:CAAX prenyl protease-like protein